MADDLDAERGDMIAAQYGGIFPPYEAFYLASLVYASGRAIQAFRRFDDARTREVGSAEIVANVHEALTHCAAVSRFFWPSRKAAITVKRAEKLRRAFGVADDSPLHSRQLRDALEHYDERLDRFLLKDMVGAIFPDPLVGSASLSEDRLGHIFRLVDPEAEEFVLLGSRYRFGDMRRGVDVVHEQAVSMMGNGARLK